VSSWHFGERTRAFKALVQNLLLVTGGLFVALLLAEVAIRMYEVGILAQGPTGWELMAVRRILYQPVENEAVNYRLKPDMEYEFEHIHVEINSQGLRDDPIALEKPQGMYRILGLGDSVTFGWQVGQEETYLAQLKRTLNARDSRQYEVINAGVPGYNLGNELAYLEEYGVGYQPDLIIVGFCALNDADGTQAVYVGDGNVAYVPLDSPSASTDSEGIVAHIKGFLRRKSHLYHFVTQQYGMLRDRLNKGSQPGGTTSRWPFPLEEDDELWELITGQIMEEQGVAEEHGAELLLVVFPTASQVMSENAPLTPQKSLTDLAQRIGVSVVDPLSAFKEHEPSLVFVDEFSHPSAFGHQLVAEEIFNVLMEKGIAVR
jgi:hypothetical protein